MDEFKVLLRAVLDSNSIGEDDIKKIEKLTDKYSVNIKTKVDKKSLISSFKAMWSEIAPLIEKKHGIKLPVELDDALLNKSLNKVYTDIDRATAKANKIQLSIDNGSYESQIEKVVASSSRWSIKNDEIRTSIVEVKAAYDTLTKSNDNDTRVINEEKFQQVLKKSKNLIEIQKTQFATDDEMSNLLKKYTDFYDKNTKAHRGWGKELKLGMHELSTSVNLPREALEKLRLQLEGIESSARAAGKLGYSAFDKFKNAISKFGGWTLASGSLMTIVQNFKNAGRELKEVNTLLTEISKANDKLSKTDLGNIANNSFDIASKYGKSATDYLSGVQEMSRAGYDAVESMAELSTAAQGAGDMTAELSNKYIIATDNAFKLNGNVQALTKTLDGANNITNNNAVNMTELAEGMSVVGSQAASSGMALNETTAALATMVATTQQSGSEMANAFKGILMNLQQVTGEIDGEEIDAESLTKYEKAAENLGVSLSEVKNGVVSLKEPMQILKELSEEYTKLDEMDAKRANLLSAVGGKVYHVTQKCVTRMNLIAGNPLEPCTTI